MKSRNCQYYVQHMRVLIEAIKLLIIVVLFIT